jgi:hypothetical protein
MNLTFAEKRLHLTSALIIFRNRTILPLLLTETGEKKVSKWVRSYSYKFFFQIDFTDKSQQFQIQLDHTHSFDNDLKPWSTWILQPTLENQMPLQPLIIEIFVDLSSFKNHEAVVITDWQGRNMTIDEFLSHSDSNSRQLDEKRSSIVVLERWKFELEQNVLNANVELPELLLVENLLPRIYKKGIVMMRSLYTLVNILPTSKLVRRLARELESLTIDSGLGVQARVVDISSTVTENLEPLMTPLFDPGSLNPASVTQECVFDGLETPVGTFRAQACYRTDCNLTVGSKKEIFNYPYNRWSEDDSARGRSRNATDIDTIQRFRSLAPNGQIEEPPDLTRAYGSLSTFHLCDRCESPISVLRNAPTWGSPESIDVKTLTPAESAPQEKNISSSTSSLVNGDDSRYKNYFSSGRQRGRSPERKSSLTHSRASSKGSASPTTSLRGVSIAPKEFSLSSSPILRSSHSSPDLHTSCSIAAEYSERRGKFVPFEHDDEDMSDFLKLLDKLHGTFPVAREDGDGILNQVGARLLAFKKYGQGDYWKSRWL